MATELILVMINNQVVQIPVESRTFYHYLKKYPPKGLLSIFEELLTPCNNFLVVGSQFNLSRERIRQLYNKYLSEHLALKTGFQRVKYCTLTRPYIKVWSSEVLAVWTTARNYGLSVQYINYQKSDKKGQVLTRKRIICIGGHDCAVRKAMKSFVTSQEGCKIKYYRFTVMPSQIEKTEFFIIMVPGSFFIVPSSFFKKIADTGIARPTIYVPESFKRDHYNGVQPKWDVLPYRNAWDQLWK